MHERNFKAVLAALRGPLRSHGARARYTRVNTFSLFTLHLPSLLSLLFHLLEAVGERSTFTSSLRLSRSNGTISKHGLSVKPSQLRHLTGELKTTMLCAIGKKWIDATFSGKRAALPVNPLAARSVITQPSCSHSKFSTIPHRPPPPSCDIKAALVRVRATSQHAWTVAVRKKRSRAAELPYAILDCWLAVCCSADTVKERADSLSLSPSRSPASSHARTHYYLC